MKLYIKGFKQRSPRRGSGGGDHGEQSLEAEGQSCTELQGSKRVEEESGAEDAPF